MKYLFLLCILLSVSVLSACGGVSDTIEDIKDELEDETPTPTPTATFTPSETPELVDEQPAREDTAPGQQPTPTPSPTPNDPPTTAPNPIATSIEYFGQGGNIWKPSGDAEAAGAGNLVVLLDAKFTTQFDTCELQKAGGGIEQLSCIDNVPWTQIPFSCFSNGNRQTWRSNHPCSNAAEVKVICKEFNQEVTFTVPAGQTHLVCQRFG